MLKVRLHSPPCSIDYHLGESHLFLLSAPVCMRAGDLLLPSLLLRRVWWGETVERNTVLHLDKKKSSGKSGKKWIHVDWSAVNCGANVLQIIWLGPFFSFTSMKSFSLLLCLFFISTHFFWALRNRKRSGKPEKIYRFLLLSESSITHSYKRKKYISK